MNINKKSIEGLKMLSAGLNLFIEGLEDALCERTEVAPTKEETPAKAKKSTKKSEPVEETTPEADEETENTNAEYTEEELNGMSYNDLKKLAKDLGITAVGNRKEIVKKILALSAETDDTEEDEPVVPAPKKSAAKKSSIKKSAPPVEEDEEDDADTEEDEDEDTDSITAQVNEIVADMSDDEIRELLDSVDISSKGKRQALISKLITAVEEGVISLDEEDDETDDADSDSEEETAEKSADVTEGMTKKRKKAYDALCEETTEAFENGDITREDLIEFINDFKGTSDKMKKVSDEDLLANYLEISAMLVSDDGEVVEEGAYYINDEPYCCGHPLTYDKKKKVYKCEVCGETYDAE